MTRFQIEVIEGDFLNRLELCDELVYQDAIVFRVIGEAVEVTCLKEYRFKDDYYLKKITEGRYFLKKEGCFFEVILVIMACNRRVQRAVWPSGEIIIAKHPQASLAFYHLGDKELFAIKNEKIITNLQDVFINGKRMNDQYLKDYDVIEIRMLRIVHHHNFNVLIGHNFHVHDHNASLLPSPLRSEIIRPLESFRKHQELRKLNYDLDIDDYLKYENSSPLFINLIQSLIMVMGMGAISLISFYTGLKDGRSALELVSLLIMPTIMLISALSLPLLTLLYNRRKVKKDLALYNKTNSSKLDTLEKTIQEDLLYNLNVYSLYYYDLSRIQKLLDDKRVYELKKDDEAFLNIAFFKVKSESGLVIKTSFKTTSEFIKKRLESIYDKYHLIEVPFKIDLKKFSLIKVIPVEDTVLKWLLILAFSHDYNDLKIALCFKKRDLYEMYGIKELRHLLKRKRLYIDDSEELKDIKERVVVFSDKLPGGRIFDNVCWLYFDKDESYQNEKMLIDLNKMLMIDYVNDLNYKISEDLLFDVDYEQYFEKLHSFVLKDVKAKNEALGLFDLYPKFTLEDYKQSSQNGLWAYFGYDENGRPLKFDISEYGIGPHGLIGGATGSGKTSFLIGFIMSMCLNYSPLELSLAIIDYKGSGIKDSLSYKGKPLKHLELSLTNLDQDEFKRSLSAFKIECERRERLFNRLSLLSNKTIFHLDDYNRTDPEKYGLEKISKFVIVIDEFAELKKEKPDFMKDVISIARIGRSLGIQLILATQKPSLSVDEEIMANVSYRIALKLLSKNDSYDLIKCDYAAKLKHKGEFYLYHNDKLIYGKAINIRLPIDHKAGAEVVIVNKRLRPIKKIGYKSLNPEYEIDRLIKTLVQYDGPIAHSAYKKPLQRKDFLALYKEYGLKKGEILFGEYDDFFKMENGSLKIKLSGNISTLVYYEKKKDQKQFMESLLSSLIISDLPYHLLCIGDLKDDFVYRGCMEVIDPNELADVYYILDSASLDDTVLLISDLERYLLDEEFKVYFEKKIRALILKNIPIFLFVNNLKAITYRLKSCFKNNYTLHISDKEEILNFFGTYNEYTNHDLFIKDGYLIGFKMAEVKALPFKAPSKHLLKTIPSQIEYEFSEKGLFMGYDKHSREKVYIDLKKGVLLSGAYSEFVERFKKIYLNEDKITYALFNEIDPKKYYHYIIWVGPNIRNQFLFTPVYKEELQNKEIYLHQRDNKDEVIIHVGG